MEKSPTPKIIFFDGYCALCNGSVKWIVNHDKNRVFKYAPLQGVTAKTKLHSVSNLPLLSSIILLDGDTVYTKSSAAIRIAKELPSPWNALALFGIIPRPFRDWVYTLIAKYRYSVFGKYETCTIPTVEDQGLFLE